MITATANPNQPDLSFEISAAKTQRIVNRDEVDQVMHWLRQADDWIRRDDLIRWLGWPRSDASRRKLRAVAKASAGLIASAPGSPGYILTSRLRPEDRRYIEALKTQADEMREHYIQIMRAWHGGVRSGEGGVRSAECGVRSAECGVRNPQAAAPAPAPAPATSVPEVPSVP